MPRFNMYVTLEVEADDMDAAHACSVEAVKLLNAWKTTLAPLEAKVNSINAIVGLDVRDMPWRKE